MTQKERGAIRPVYRIEIEPEYPSGIMLPGKYFSWKRDLLEVLDDFVAIAKKPDDYKDSDFHVSRVAVREYATEELIILLLYIGKINVQESHRGLRGKLVHGTWWKNKHKDSQFIAAIERGEYFDETMELIIDEAKRELAGKCNVEASGS